MSKLEEAKQILNDLQVPVRQQNEMCCLTLLALAGIGQDDEWKDATNHWMRIHDILIFVRGKYDVNYAENTRENIRKKAIHNFRNAAFVEDAGEATNCPRYSYHLTDEMLRLLQSFGTDEWEFNLSAFQENHETLIQFYASKRIIQKMPVKINGQDFTFSTGKHNQLQKAIIEEFAPRFAPNSEYKYLVLSEMKKLRMPQNREHTECLLLS